MTVRPVEAAERSAATNIQLLAFASDPVMRWLWPDPDAYIRHFPELVRTFGGRAFENDAAHVSEDFRGGALWLPPGVGPDDDGLEALARDRVGEPIRSALRSIFEEMSESVPAAPHWHLAFIGVDPFWHGQGIGAALLGYALDRVDDEGAEAYLESTNPRNISLYERYGFAVTREIRVGGAPPLFPMLRRPR
ncbi:MAG: GNAT family N-acetyltransferase [Chloroflexota bacterium]